MTCGVALRCWAREVEIFFQGGKDGAVEGYTRTEKGRGSAEGQDGPTSSRRGGKGGGLPGLAGRLV